MPEQLAAILQTSRSTWTYGTYGGFGGGGYGTTGNVTDFAYIIFYLINNVAVPLLFAVAFIVFLYGVAQTYIFSHGDQEAVGKGHKLILWGIIGFVVMISIWGLVNVVANTFGLGGQYAPETPYSPVNTSAQPSNLRIPGEGSVPGQNPYPDVY
jgi:hypothetical protein